MPAESACSVDGLAGAQRWLPATLACLQRCRHHRFSHAPRRNGAQAARQDEMKDVALQDQFFDVTLVTPYGPRRIRVRASEHIWDEAKAAGINLPAICHQGRCLTCAGKLAEPGEFDPSDAVSYYPQDRAAGYILLCTAKARSNLRIRTHAQTEMRAYRKEMGLPAPYA
jgi:ferredoxin